jgi:hypothetical protein
LLLFFRTYLEVKIEENNKDIESLCLAINESNFRYNNAINQNIIAMNIFSDPIAFKIFGINIYIYCIVNIIY